MPFRSVKDTMHEFKHGNLHSGKRGPVVKDPKQAIAIALSQQRQAQREEEETSKFVRGYKLS